MNWRKHFIVVSFVGVFMNMNAKSDFRIDYSNVGAREAKDRTINGWMG